MAEAEVDQIAQRQRAVAVQTSAWNPTMLMERTSIAVYRLPAADAQRMRRALVKYILANLRPKAA
jgi:hypothetical protein